MKSLHQKVLAAVGTYRRVKVLLSDKMLEGIAIGLGKLPPSNDSNEPEYTIIIASAKNSEGTTADILFSIESEVEEVPYRSIINFEFA